MGFYRYLSPIEATFTATDSPTYTPFVNQFFVEGQGELNLDDWKRAVEIASLANPGMCLILRGNWGWRYWDDAGPKPTVRKINTIWDGRSSEDAAEIDKPINPYIGPNAEVILIESSTAAPKILIRSHHAITDARGIQHWAEECFRALRGEKLKGSQGKSCEWDIAKNLERPAYTLKTGGCAPVTSRSTKPTERRCRWTTALWEGKFTKVVPKLILAAANLARSRHRDGKVIFRIPSDLRRYAEKDAPFSLANSIGAIDLEIPTDATPNSIQSQIIRAMRNKDDTSVFKNTVPLLNWLPRFLFNKSPKSLIQTHSSGLYRMTGIISYMGDVDYVPLKYKKFEAKLVYGIPIPLEDRSIFLGASLAPNGLMITVSVPKALANHEELLTLCDELKSELLTI